MATIFAQGAALVAGAVITFLLSHQVDNRPLGQGRRLVENEPPGPGLSSFIGGSRQTLVAGHEFVRLFPNGTVEEIM